MVFDAPSRVLGCGAGSSLGCAVESALEAPPGCLVAVPARGSVVPSSRLLCRLWRRPLLLVLLSVGVTC
jgi:hypothetical protein